MHGNDYLRAALMSSVVLALVGIGAKAADRPAKRTIGLALVAAPLALYETKDGKECPEGLHHTNKDN